jgi:predicted nucleic acid-binding protein
MTEMFFDTGVVLKLVIEEPLSPLTRAFVIRRGVPVPLSLLIELEIENALQALRFRREITAEQLAGSRGLVTEMIRRGRFEKIDLSLDEIGREAFSLVPLVTAKTGCRTLDLMHIATAKLLGACEFVSTDKRQIEAAKLCGFKIVNLLGKAR